MRSWTRQISLVLAVCLLLASLPLGAAASDSLGFDDVTSDSWYYSYVHFAAEKNIMQGTDERTFSPQVQLNRAMLVTILWRMAGNPAVTFQSVFDDVPSDAPAWYRDAVIWANENGIVQGFDGRFNPHGEITREQFAVMLHRYAYQMTDRDTRVTATWQWSHFTDRSQIANWAIAGLTWANYHGIITDRTLTTIVPDGVVTRAEAATVLMRFHLPFHELTGNWTISHYTLGENGIERPWNSVPYALFFSSGAGFSYTSGTARVLFRAEENQLIGVALWDPENKVFLTYHPESQFLQYTFFDKYNSIYVHHFFARTTDEETNLQVQFATDEVLSQFASFHEFIESDKLGHHRIVITTDRLIWNVAFYSYNYNFDQRKPSFFIEKFTPDVPLVIAGMDWDVVDHRGIFFITANGFPNYLTMVQNYDGSFGLEFFG